MIKFIEIKNRILYIFKNPKENVLKILLIALTLICLFQTKYLIDNSRNKSEFLKTISSLESDNYDLKKKNTDLEKENVEISEKYENLKSKYSSYLNNVNNFIKRRNNLNSSNTYTSIPSGSYIETKIDGNFEGWEGETIFKMRNGTIWQQASYSYKYHYAYAPDVMIYSKSGGIYMKVEGIDDEIRVKRIK